MSERSKQTAPRSLLGNLHSLCAADTRALPRLEAYLAPGAAGVGVLLAGVAVAHGVPGVVAVAEGPPGGGAAGVGGADPQHTGVRNGRKHHAAAAQQGHARHHLGGGWAGAVGGVAGPGHCRCAGLSKHLASHVAAARGSRPGHGCCTAGSSACLGADALADGLDVGGAAVQAGELAEGGVGVFQQLHAEVTLARGQAVGDGSEGGGHPGLRGKDLA